MELYAWRDRFDGDMISLGVTTKSGRYVCWGQIHIDGIEEMFGKEVLRRIPMAVDEKAFTKPICIESDQVSVDGEPLWDQKLEDFC